MARATFADIGNSTTDTGEKSFRHKANILTSASFGQNQSYAAQFGTLGDGKESLRLVDRDRPCGYRALVHKPLEEETMSDNNVPNPIEAVSVPIRAPLMTFPEPLASLMAGRERRALGDAFGLTRFGVNLTRLSPGSISAARHSHSLQDEFVYVLEGNPILITNSGETLLRAGMCIGFRAGTGNAHHLVNRTEEDVLYLEIGDRTADDAVSYPDDDIALVRTSEGRWEILHKDGSPY